MITKQIVLKNYDWISDEAALLNGCLTDDTVLAMVTACKSLNILGWTSIDNGHSDDCVGYVEFDFAPEDQMLYTIATGLES